MRYIVQFVLIGFIGFLLIIVFRILKKEEQKNKNNKGSKSLEEIQRDPVCGIYIPVSQAIKYNSKKTTQYFCSEKCLEIFKNNERDKKNGL